VKELTTQEMIGILSKINGMNIKLILNVFQYFLVLMKLNSTLVGILKPIRNLLFVGEMMKN